MTSAVGVASLKHRAEPTPDRQDFWLRELRTAEFLVEAGRLWPEAARRQVACRPLLEFASENNPIKVAQALEAEEAAERERDRIYWAPLKAELEQLRQTEMRRRT